MATEKVSGFSSKLSAAFEPMIKSRMEMNNMMQAYIFKSLFGNLSGTTGKTSANNQAAKLMLLSMLMNQGGYGNIGFGSNPIMQLVLMSALSNGDANGYDIGTDSYLGTETVEDDFGEFKDIDANGNGKINRTEYQNYYMALKQKENGEIIDKNHKDYKKYKNEANQLFNALNKNGVISEKRYLRMLNAFDRMDSKKDGVIDTNLMQKSLQKIVDKGADADIHNGKSLSQLVDMEA